MINSSGDFQGIPAGSSVPLDIRQSENSQKTARVKEIVFILGAALVAVALLAITIASGGVGLGLLTGAIAITGGITAATVGTLGISVSVLGLIGLATLKVAIAVRLFKSKNKTNQLELKIAEQKQQLVAQRILIKIATEGISKSEAELAVKIEEMVIIGQSEMKKHGNVSDLTRSFQSYDMMLEREKEYGDFIEGEDEYEVSLDKPENFHEKVELLKMITNKEYLSENLLKGLEENQGKITEKYQIIVSSEEEIRHLEEEIGRKNLLDSDKKDQKLIVTMNQLKRALNQKREVFAVMQEKQGVDQEAIEDMMDDLFENLSAASLHPRKEQSASEVEAKMPRFRFSFVETDDNDYGVDTFYSNGKHQKTAVFSS